MVHLPATISRLSRLLLVPAFILLSVPAQALDLTLEAGPLGEELERLTGARLERRKEGVALLAPGHRFSDLPFPRGGAAPHAALLLAALLYGATFTFVREAMDEAPPQRTDRAVLMSVGEAMVHEADSFVPPTAITTEVHHHHGGDSAPRATPAWMLAAAAVLFMALGTGFFAGRMTVPPIPMASPSTSHATLATFAGGDDVHRMHSVGLRQSGLEGLMAGDTWLLAGPRGGPYRVVGRVNVDTLDRTALPAAGNEEIVVAVASEGQWAPDKRLALNDLSDPGVSILARRSLAQR